MAANPVESANPTAMVFLSEFIFVRLRLSRGLGCNQFGPIDRRFPGNSKSAIVQPLGEVIPLADHLVVLQRRRQHNQRPPLGDLGVGKIFLE